ncbi:MAG: hypothetical protein HDS11_05955 [Bacteroides sp.]|nr:hypothetical protein [Bacteroides sp.]
MKKQLSSLVCLFSAAASFAGTVYEQTSLENVLANNEPFALVGCGTVMYKNQPQLIWSCGFPKSNSNGARGYTIYNSQLAPERFDRYVIASATGDKARPASFSLEEAGTQELSDGSIRQFYNLRNVVQYAAADVPQVKYMGISSSQGPFDSTSDPTALTASKFKIFIEHATNTWTNEDGETVTTDKCYKISSQAQPARAMMMLVNTKNGAIIGAGSSNITTDLVAQNNRYPFMYRIIPTVEKIFGPEGENTCHMDVYVGRPTSIPALVLKTISENGVALADPRALDNITFGYEVTEGAGTIDINEADGTFTGVAGGNAVVKVTLSGVAADAYDIEEPFFITVHVPTPSAISFTGSRDAINIAEGTDGARIPAPVLTSNAGSTVDGASFTYEVVDAQGNPLTDAAISVDAEGNITVNHPGQAFVKVTLSGDNAADYEAEPALFEVNITRPADIFVNGLKEAAAPRRLYSGTSSAAAAPQLKVREADGSHTDVAAASFTYQLADENGNLLTDAEGRPLTANDLVTVDPATGAVTAKEGALGNVYVAAVPTAETAKVYDAAPYIYAMSVKPYSEVTYVRISNNAELNLAANSKVIMVDPRTLGENGYAAAGATATGTSPYYTYSPVDLGMSSLPEVLNLNSDIADELLKIDVYYAYGKDAKVNEADGYRMMIDGLYGMRDYYNAAIKMVDRTTVDAANGGGGFWYNISATDGNFTVRTGRNYLGFDANGILTHVSSASLIALYTIKKDATLEADNTTEQSVTLNPGSLAAIPAPSLKATLPGDSDAETVEGLSFTYTVVDADGNPFAEGEAPIAVDENGNVTTLSQGNARVKVTVAAPFDKFFSNNAYYYDVKVNAPTQVRLEVDNAATGETVLTEGTTNSVPRPSLINTDGTPVDHNDGLDIQGGSDPVTYAYTVVDENGNPFAEGEAPIAVDANGNITTLKPGKARVEVSLSGNSALKYSAEPYYYDVFVSAPATLEVADNNPNLLLTEGTSENVPTPVLTVDGMKKDDATFTYTVVDENGQPFAEGEAPIEVDADGNITTLKPGTAKVIVSLSDESAKLYDATPVEYFVTVAPDSNSGTTTAIDAIEAAADTQSTFFTLQGVKVSNPKAGFYIKVTAGKVEKIQVR